MRPGGVYGRSGPHVAGVGGPRAPHSAKAAAVPSRPAADPSAASMRRYIIIGAGTLVAIVCVLFIALSQPAAKCPGAAKLKGPKSGSAVADAFTLGVSLENRGCVSAVTYRMDGEDVQTETSYPYEAVLNVGKLSRTASERGTHEFTAVVEDTRGETHAIADKLSLSFANGAPPEPGGEAEAQVSAEPGREATPEASPAGTPEPVPTARHNELGSECRELANQISRKSGYTFSPEFTSLVEQRMAEYRGVPASEMASRFRYEVNKAFRDMGAEPLVGYVLAFSRSKFDSDEHALGVGLWQIPPAVARASNYLPPGESDASLKDPKRSAEIAAAYWKNLLNSFDEDDFMYAVACFGMSESEAGQVSSRLSDAAPDTASRHDIMKMFRAGVINQAQVDRVARFFAAGIIGEHPQTYGRKGGQSFSSLYN